MLPAASVTETVAVRLPEQAGDVGGLVAVRAVHARGGATGGAGEGDGGRGTGVEAGQAERDGGAARAGGRVGEVQRHIAVGGGVEDHAHRGRGGRDVAGGVGDRGRQALRAVAARERRGHLHEAVRKVVGRHRRSAGRRAVREHLDRVAHGRAGERDPDHRRRVVGAGARTEVARPRHLVVGDGDDGGRARRRGVDPQRAGGVGDGGVGNDDRVAGECRGWRRRSAGSPRGWRGRRRCRLRPRCS